MSVGEAAPPGVPVAEPSTGQRAARGGVWTLVGYGGGQVVRLAASIVLYRLVPQPDFGLVVVAWTVLQGLSMFSDLGIVTSIVQNRRGAERSFRDTAFTVQVLRNLAIALLAVAAAPFAERFYEGYDGIAALLIVCAVHNVVVGFESTALAVMSRNLQLRTLALLNLGIQVLTSVATIVWALLDASAWALVGGTLIGALVKTVLSHVAWGRDRFGWDRAAWTELFKFGKWVFVSTALVFLVAQADRLIFARLITREMIAVYGLAVQIAMIVPEISGRLTGGVLFPAYCRVVNGGGTLAASFDAYRRPIMLLSGFGFAMCCGAASAGVDWVYPSEYEDAAWMLQLLAAGAWFGYALQGAHGVALLALGHPRLVARTSVAKLVGMVVLIPVGYRYAGFPGAVAAYAGTDVLRYATMVVATHGIGIRALATDLRLTTFFAVTAAAGWFAQQFVETAGGSALLRCVVAGGVVTALWAPLLVPAVREIRGRLRE